MAEQAEREITSALERNGFRVLRLGMIRPGTRGVSATASVIGPDGEVLNAFAKVNLADEPCFRRELAAARWMNGCIGHLPAPLLLCADESARVIVWEELDGVRPLSELLDGSDAEEAEEALAFVAWSLAALHLGTASRRAVGESCLHSRAAEEASALRFGAATLSELLLALGADVPSNLDEAIEALAREHQAVGPLVALTHGDNAPSNVLCGPNRAWLVDFEFAAYRPMLYDLATWTTLCPLPNSHIDAMLALYRARLAEEMPEVTTPAFFKSWATCCAFRVLSMAVWFGEGIARENGPWGDGGWDRRSALATALRRASEALNEVEDLEAVRALVTSLADATEGAWDVRPLRFAALNIERRSDPF